MEGFLAASLNNRASLAPVGLFSCRTSTCRMSGAGICFNWAHVLSVAIVPTLGRFTCLAPP